MKTTTIEKCVIGLIALIILAIVGNFVMSFGLFSEREVEFTVSKTEIVNYYSKNSMHTHHYMVYADNGVYECAGYLYTGLPVEELYGQFVPGEKYSCVIRGYRSVIFTTYPQIIRVLRKK